MQVNLERVDYVNIGSTMPKCMEILPSNKIGTPQKIAVVNKEGLLQVFSVKNSEINVLFKTNVGKSASCLCLGGAVNTVQDKIFVAVENEIKGYTKKGKNFLTFDCAVNDIIKGISVYGNNLMIFTEFTYKRFYNLKEENYFMCMDAINDIVVIPSQESVEDCQIVLACQDRILRILNGSEIEFEVEVPSVPSSCCLYGNDGGESGREIVYGTIDGQLGLIGLYPDDPKHDWMMPNLKNRGAILSIHFYDVNGDGVLDLLCGRDDGYIEIYRFNETGEPELSFTHAITEGINCVRGGEFSVSNHKEIAVCTYQGWVFGLSSEAQEKAISSTKKEVITEDTTKKIASLQAEIKHLSTALAKEREEYQNLGATGDSYLVAPKYKIRDKFIISREDASYLLCIECDNSIDNVLVQSDVVVDILDADRNSSVVSFSSVNLSDSNQLLVTYRCQANTTRIEIKFRTIEGQYGTLRCYITPNMQPKTSLCKEYLIKPLSLHQRAHSFDSTDPLNRLQIEGNFSLAEMHAWIKFCLPEVPEKLPDSDECRLLFSSIFLDTSLECLYKKGVATFTSTNISTVSILRDVISREATKKKVNLNISADFNNDSIESVLKLIHPKLVDQIFLARRVQLIDGLKDLQVQENNLDFLAPEYKEILEQADSLKAIYKRQPTYLERLYGMITDLFIDKFKIKGINVKNKVAQLIEILDTYDYKRLITFFDDPINFS